VAAPKPSGTLPCSHHTTHNNVPIVLPSHNRITQSPSSFLPEVIDIPLYREESTDRSTTPEIRAIYASLRKKLIPAQERLYLSECGNPGRGESGVSIACVKRRDMKHSVPMACNLCGHELHSGQWPGTTIYRSCGPLGHRCSFLPSTDVPKK